MQSQNLPPQRAPVRLQLFRIPPPARPAAPALPASACRQPLCLLSMATSTASECHVATQHHLALCSCLQSLQSSGSPYFLKAVSLNSRLTSSRTTAAITVGEKPPQRLPSPPSGLSPCSPPGSHSCLVPWTFTWPTTAIPV